MIACLRNKIPHPAITQENPSFKSGRHFG